MKIINTFPNANDMESITLLTRTGLNAVRQLRRGEPVYLACCAAPAHKPSAPKR